MSISDQLEQCVDKVEQKLKRERDSIEPNSRPKKRARVKPRPNLSLKITKALHDAIDDNKESDFGLPVESIIDDCGYSQNADSKRLFNHILKTLQHLGIAKHERITKSWRYQADKTVVTLEDYMNPEHYPGNEASALDVQMMHVMYVLMVDREMPSLSVENVVQQMHGEHASGTAVWRSWITLTGHILDTLACFNLIERLDLVNKWCLHIVKN